MKKYTAQIFKSSGKWYTDIEIQLIVNSTIGLYDQIGQSIRRENVNYDYCQPSSRTLDSWFAVVVVDEFPMVIWFY